jgi:hypothetical protein
LSGNGLIALMMTVAQGVSILDRVSMASITSAVLLPAAHWMVHDWGSGGDPLWAKHPTARLALARARCLPCLVPNLVAPGSDQPLLASEADRQWAHERLQQAQTCGAISALRAQQLHHLLDDCRWVAEIYDVLLDAVHTLDDQQIDALQEKLAQAAVDGRLDPHLHHGLVEQWAAVGDSSGAQALCDLVNDAPTTDTRDRVNCRLADAYAAGYLTADEFNARMAHAQQAPTVQQMRTVLRGLPL